MGFDTSQNTSATNVAPPALPAPQQVGGSAPEPQELTADQRRMLVFSIIVIVLLMAALIVSVVFLMNAPYGEVARIRDIFIIFLAIQSLLTGFALVILIIQLARLINLLQNEVKPILESTNETVSNLRGTTVFLSENLTEPVIKMNEYLAGMSQLFYVLGITKRSSKKGPPKGV
jgi:hypothetical protein